MFREYLPTCITKLENRKSILFFKNVISNYIYRPKKRLEILPHLEVKMNPIMRRTMMNLLVMMKMKTRMKMKKMKMSKLNPKMNQLFMEVDLLP